MLRKWFQVCGILAITGFAGCFTIANAQSPKTITNSIGMKLVLIPKGTFTMGSPPNERGSEEDERQHEVTISKDYYLGAFEVTQAQYSAVMGVNPSHFQDQKVAERHPETGRIVKDVDASNHPVDQVSWNDAIAFCKRLSALQKEKSAGRKYRLPTEAEWEYACRARSNGAYCFGNDPLELIWLSVQNWKTGRDDKAIAYHAYVQDNRKMSNAVGGKLPNDFGLYDIHGNVTEWCMDWYGEYPKSHVIDPTGPSSGKWRVQRGGSWSGVPGFGDRCARRSSSEPWKRSKDHTDKKNAPDSAYSDYGFRVVLE
jgi:formylglycine-generating enzyme required for sulfatase activity